MYRKCAGLGDKPVDNAKSSVSAQDESRDSGGKVEVHRHEAKNLHAQYIENKRKIRKSKKIRRFRKKGVAAHAPNP